MNRLAALFALGLACHAQVDYTTATLKGAILDPQSKTVLNAEVTAVNQATGVARTAMSGEEGYQIPSLPPGLYRVEVRAAGFARSVARDVTLNVGQAVIYDVSLTLGADSTVLEVTASIPLVQPEQTQQSNIIGSVQVGNLPNVTRSFVQSIYTLPGVSNSYAPALQHPGVGTGYQSSGFSIGASNGRSNLVTIDGGENEYGSGTMRVIHVPLDSIQEFQVNRSSFGAEFGFTTGTAINMVTKSGSNNWHGSGATYFRNRLTSAQNFFNRLAGTSKEPFEQSAIFSGTLGGPIRKNRLFVFTAPEFQKLDTATVRNVVAEAQFQGVTAQPNGFDRATGVCPNQRSAQQQVTQHCYLTQLANSGGSLGPLGAGLLSSAIFDPLRNPILRSLVTANDGTFNGILSGPAGSGARAIPGYNTPRGRYANWVSRFDYLPGSRDAFTLRFSLEHERDDVVPAPPYSSYVALRDYTITGSWTRTIGGRLANTLRIQVVPTNTASNGAPNPNGSEISLGDRIQFGTPFSLPYDARWKRFQFEDNVSLVWGTHTFKAGGTWRPAYYNVRQEVWTRGQWQFTDGAYSILDIVAISQGPAVAAALAGFNLSRGYPVTGPPSTNLTAAQSYAAGAPTLLVQADPESNPQWEGWANSLGFYAQDSWKVSPRLTMNYGLRFDHYREPSPVPARSFVTPRLGFAWQPGGNQKTVVRAGAGMYVAPTIFMVPLYTNLLGDSGKYINQGALVAGLPSPPFPSIFAAWALHSSLATPSNPNPGLSRVQLASVGAVISPPGPNAFGNFIYTLGPNFRPAYSIQASVSIARQLTSNLSIEAAYLMYRSVHVLQSLETNFVLNRAAPVDPFAGPSFIPRPGTTKGQPNAAIFQNNALSSTGTGYYHGGTLSLTRRFERKLQFGINYTFSRAIDNTSDYSSISSPFRPEMLNLDRARSLFDITHNLVANAVYMTPFRARRDALWSSLLADWTVSPILYARSGVPFSILVPGLSNGTVGHNGTARPWYAGRNTGNGPNFINTDLRVSKALLGKDRPVGLEFIAQAQNLFNRANFAVVNNNFPADPNFPLPSGGTLRDGPFRVEGFAPSSVAVLSTPLAYTAANPARHVTLALRLSF